MKAIHSVITDDSITNYNSIIKEGLISKFSHSELIEILESLDSERLKAFLISITDAVGYFEEFNDYETGKSFRYIVNLEKFLSNSLKVTMVNIIKNSEHCPFCGTSVECLELDQDLVLCSNCGEKCRKNELKKF